MQTELQYDNGAPGAGKNNAAQSRPDAKVAAWLAEPGHHLLVPDDTAYPPMLREISGHPRQLYVRGDPSVLVRPMLAIVGSRSCTPYGREIAFRLSAELAAKGFVICSGLASGIDTEAHKAAVKMSAPTVAVLGNGLSDVYPAKNRQLAADIVAPALSAPGALVSELPLDAAPIASHFPSRNRIISGLSLGVCVIEANMRSGSLITARLALEQNREVFAVPGSINSYRSRGCHQLLRQGAVLVESADDIVAHVESLYRGQLDLLSRLQTSASGESKAPYPGARVAERSSGETAVLDHIGTDPVSIDTLVQRTGLGIGRLSQILLALELGGTLRKTGGCWQRV